MRGDPEKCIASFEIKHESDEILLVVTLRTGVALVMRREGLTFEQAETFSRGMKKALRWASPEKMKRVMAGELRIVIQRPPEADLFSDGLKQGFDAAAEGYWLPHDETTGGCRDTRH